MESTGPQSPFFVHEPKCSVTVLIEASCWLSVLSGPMVIIIKFGKVLLRPPDRGV